MKVLSTAGSVPRCLLVFTLTLGFVAFCRQPCAAQSGTLAEPFPAPAANAALHYQRALLHLAQLDEEQLEDLDKPLWEMLPVPPENKLPATYGRLLYKARFAVRSAATGSRIAECNFGIDFSQTGAAAQLPHLAGMVRLGRLLTLRGSLAEAREEWEEAAIIYFDGLRMGRHLAHQSTLLEGLAGIEILRNNYFALARWATRCPSRAQVARAFGLLESLQGSLVQPAQLLSRESSILALEFDQLRDAYPEGNWAELILESAGESVTGERDQDAQRAKEMCLANGVPEEVFASPTSFREYVTRLRVTAQRFAESVTACMTLPPPARLQRASGLLKKYEQLVTLLAADTLVDPVEIGALFAEHEAELTVTRIALAAAANRTETGFPAELKEVAKRFGGQIPPNPYTGDAVEYQSLDEARGFSLMIPAQAQLPEVRFSSSPPSAVE